MAIMNKHRRESERSQRPTTCWRTFVCVKNTKRAFNIRLLRASYRQRKIIEHNGTKIYIKSLVLLLVSMNGEQSMAIRVYRPRPCLLHNFLLFNFSIVEQPHSSTLFAAMDMTVLSRNFVQSENWMRIIALIIGWRKPNNQTRLEKIYEFLWFLCFCVRINFICGT